MMIRILFKGIQVENSTIIDGHHRYIASLLADYEIEKFESIRSVAKMNIEWNLVKITEEDWDTTSKIEKLNIEDANYNGITLEELQMKLK